MMSLKRGGVSPQESPGLGKGKDGSGNGGTGTGPFSGHLADGKILYNT